MQRLSQRCCCSGWLPENWKPAVPDSQARLPEHDGHKVEAVNQPHAWTERPKVQMVLAVNAEADIELLLQRTAA